MFVDAVGHRLKKTGDFWHHDKRSLPRERLYPRAPVDGYDCPVVRFVLDEERRGFPTLGNEIAYEV